MQPLRTSSVLCFCLLVASLVAGCSAPDQSTALTTISSPPLRVASYNIRYNNPDDGEHAWPYRKDRVVSTIRFNGAHLIGMQEVLKNQMDDLAQGMDEYQWIGVGRDDGKEAGEYAPIFYRTDRLEVLESGTFWLSKNPDIPGSKDWDAALTRIATWAHFKDLATDSTFYHVNTHFDHRGELAREKSAELIAHRATRMAGTSPIIVTGDFNFVETTPGYRALTAAFQDAYYATEEPHHGPAGTFSGFEVGATSLERRIDYIFVQENVRVLQHAILSDNWKGAYSSDHLAVLATVQLPM